MHKIKVWDNYTRLYHLSQLCLLALLWYSADNAYFELHFVCGFILAGLWISRIVWGFMGSETSRFNHFVRSPITVIQAWRNNRISQPHIGHNPVGGYMVIALLITLMVQIISGLFATDDVFAEGPLYGFASEKVATYMDSLHSSNFDVLLGLIAVHALAGVFHVMRGDNVIASIVTGYKKSSDFNHNLQPQLKSVLTPLFIWFSSAGALYYFAIEFSSY
ncbi:cytochrome b/b6 domain-containing protein [Thalassotalea maritima]|uniref:cytochrome b/b6 domain-containing protein n=1 Tax=Thalassotalea maritima TaxID=3242416 RepID=UPI003528CF26